MFSYSNFYLDNRILKEIYSRIYNISIIDGIKRYYKNNKLHRDGDEPASIWSRNYLEWYKEGKLHRDGDEPAIDDGYIKHWFKRGERHRDGDEPACILHDGSKEWWKEGKLHRDGDKPAIIWSDGTRFWYKEGILQSMN